MILLLFCGIRSRLDLGSLLPERLIDPQQRLIAKQPVIRCLRRTVRSFTGILALALVAWVLNQPSMCSRWELYQTPL